MLQINQAIGHKCVAYKSYHANVIIVYSNNYSAKWALDINYVLLGPKDIFVPFLDVENQQSKSILGKTFSPKKVSPKNPTTSVS